ncbi:MAG: carbon-nitrogen hydrolase family protein [Pseudomonadota bacterium]
MSRFIAAVVQMRSGTDPQANIDAMETGVRQAAAQGATFVQTPEMTGMVQARRSAFFDALKVEEDDPLVPRAAKLAKELGVHIHIGSTPVLADDGRAANRAFLFAPDGEIIATYDKIHMFDVDLDNGESWRESAVYNPGNYAVLAEMGDTKIGMGICYDCRFPSLSHQYAIGGAQVLAYPSCFTRQTGRAHWHTLLRARAIETGSFVIAAAQGGDHEDGRETYGHSLIIGPWGDVLAEVEGEEPGIAVAEIDTARSDEARAKIPNLKNDAAYRVIAP